MQRRVAALLLMGAAALFLSRPAAAVEVAAELSTRNVRADESNLADVIADAVRALEKTDAAVMTASSFNETTVPKGDSNPEVLLGALANRDDTVVVMNLTGAQVRKALERGLALSPQRSIAFLQVSGLLVTYDPAADKDHRVLTIKVGKTPIDPAKTYTVAMPAPLAAGALAYDAVWSRADMDHDTGKSLAQAVTDYLRTTKVVGAKNEERLVAKK